MVHDIEFAPNLEYVFKQTLPVLQEAVKEGKVRYLGVTGYPVSILQRAVESSPIKLNVVLSYCRNTLIDDSLSEILPLLQILSSFSIKIIPHGTKPRAEVKETLFSTE
uniref:NADP-dependent oxidoreductase domain-containing protein n=1 Tax=Timema cristinae TaxID=61476 RepID=A0A7R9H633_TIMCR|nr:unnamed protein product [Timema cristinae]